MLIRLSIRDIVLIDRLDIDFAAGLAVLTGETGAGKSILLDAFALALGARGDVALVRQGAEQGQVTAAFDLPGGHPARALLAQNDIPADDELILGRCSMPSAVSIGKRRPSRAYGTSGAPARWRSPATVRRSNVRNARPIGCVTPSRN
jgi:DNA repair ATPase RecN